MNIKIIYVEVFVLISIHFFIVVFGSENRVYHAFIEGRLIATNVIDLFCVSAGQGTHYYYYYRCYRTLMRPPDNNNNNTRRTKGLSSVSNKTFM